MKAEHMVHIRRLRDELLDLARRGPVPNILEIAAELAEMSGMVAGVATARRAKECCDACATPAGVNSTADAATNIFRTYLEEAAVTTAKRLGMEDPFPNRRRDTEDRRMSRGRMRRAAESEVRNREATPQYIDIVFDTIKVEGKPDESRFVEVEDHNGKSMHAGEWIERHDGHSVLRIRPDVFGAVVGTVEETEAPERDEAQTLASLLRGLGIDVTVAATPMEALLAMTGINLPPTTLSKIRRGSQHDKMCDCSSCLEWWIYAGPDGGVPGDYGPFSKDVINASQHERGIEVTP